MIPLRSLRSLREESCPGVKMFAVLPFDVLTAPSEVEGRFAVALPASPVSATRRRTRPAADPAAGPYDEAGGVPLGSGGCLRLASDSTFPGSCEPLAAAAFSRLIAS
jgi:hypothetical protein